MCPIGAAIELRDGHPVSCDEALTAACFAAAPEPLAIVDGERVLFANAAFADLFGGTVPEELVGCSRSAAAGRPLCSRVDATDTGWSQHGHRLCHFAGSRPDGSHTQIEATCSTLEWQGRELLVVSMRDISHRERRRAVRDSEKHYQAIFQASAMSMLQCSLEGRILKSNPAAENLFGYPGCELRGMLFSDFIHPEDVAIEQPVFLELAVGTRDSYQVEIRYVGKDEKTGWIRRNVSLVRGPAGEPRAAIAMMEDITERKRAEQQLRDAQKMEAVGRLVGGVSHDFNNLLTGIMLYCDLLLAGLDRSSRLGHHAEEIRLAAEQGAALIQQLLAIARQQVIEPRLLCLNEIVSRTQNLLSRLIGESIAFQIQLDEGLGDVRMDPAQVQQILFNLVLNARDAMPRGGRIVVETVNCEFTPPGRLPAGTQISGVRLTVADEGSGMDSETLSHLFEPFFTTKKPGRGNGLGLATVHDIVQNNGGAIEVESALGRGTTVRVYLPRLLEPMSKVPEARFSEGPIGETILLLEDNLTVRRAAERVLTECGYRVLEAANGADALALAESFPGTVDLVLADVDLPGMSGREVARQLSAARPGLKSLYMSGYKLVEDEEPGSNDSIVFFPKPFTGAVLLQRVREILDAHPAPARERESQI